MNIKKDNYLKLESDCVNSLQTNLSFNVSNSIRSPLSSNNHLILNFYEESSNLNSSSSNQSNVEFCINDSINNNNNDDNNNDNNNNNDNDNNNNNNYNNNDDNNNDNNDNNDNDNNNNKHYNNNEHIKNNLNQTSTFLINDSNNFSHQHSNLGNSIFSQQPIYSKLNSIEQISFKQEGMKNFEFSNDDAKNYCLTINNISNNSINIQEEKLSQNSLKNNNILLNADTIPIYTQQLNLKMFNDYILNNKPIIYSKKTLNKQILGFSAMTFNNNCEENTKISININLGDDKKNSINYFILYQNTLKDDILNNIISSNFEEQNKMIKEINDEILLFKNQNNDLTVLSNINSIDKVKENYIIILSSNNANDLKIINNEEIIKSEKNLDFLILINKGIFKFLYCIEINFIIYSILKTVILYDMGFNYFLEQIIISIIEQTIINGGNLGMSIIFVCLEGIRKIFDNKDINKIDEILKRLETLKYEVDFQIMNYNENLNIGEINTPQILKNNNCSNITFTKTLTSEEVEKLDKKKKNISIFKCCGL